MGPVRIVKPVIGNSDLLSPKVIIRKGYEEYANELGDPFPAPSRFWLK
jgi:hypothetical protein